jgi:hypothetical protein
MEVKRYQRSWWFLNFRKNCVKKRTAARSRSLLFFLKWILQIGRRIRMRRRFILGDAPANLLFFDFLLKVKSKMSVVANADPLQPCESPIRSRHGTGAAGWINSNSSFASPHALGNSNSFDGDVMDELTLIQCSDSKTRFAPVAAAVWQLTPSPTSEQQHYVVIAVESEADSSTSSMSASACGSPSLGSSGDAVVTEDDQGWQPMSQRRGSLSGAAEKCSSALRPTHRTASPQR